MNKRMELRPEPKTSSQSSITSSVQPDEPAIHPAFVKLLLCIALAVGTFLVYCGCLDHPFANYDDPAYVTTNAHVLSGLTRDNVSWAFTTFHFANYHPLTWLSLQLDATLYGGAKAGRFHFTNIVLHIASAVLLFLFLCRFTDRVWPSFVVAALFALHPQQVESVAWIAERKGLLSTLFWMLALTAYGSYVLRPGVGRYLLVALALTGGLLSKGMAVTLPCVLLLLDYWPLGRWIRGPQPARTDIPAPARLSLGRLVLEKAPLFALVVIGSVLAFVGQQRGQAVATLEQFPLSQRLGNAILAYVGYIGKMLWPEDLAVYYPHPRSTISLFAVLAAGVLLVGLTAFVLVRGRRWPYLAVGWLWYVGTLVPVIGLVQLNAQAMADRYNYLPCIGVYLILVWGATDALGAWKLPQPAGFFATVIVLSLCAVLTWNQVGYWASDLTLWQHAAAVTPQNPVACTSLGAALHNTQRYKQALTEYQKAVQMAPRYTPARYHLGVLLIEMGRFDEAVDQFLHIYPDDPEYWQARGKLGLICHYQGLLVLARSFFAEVVAHDPDSAAAHRDLGIALRDLHRLEESQAELERATELDPHSFPNHTALSHILLERGQYEEAEVHLRQAINLLPPQHLMRGVLDQELQNIQSVRNLEKQLPAALADKNWPRSSREKLIVAAICQQKRWRRYDAAASRYVTAFADAEVNDLERQQHRYSAVIAAALAGTAEDNPPLTAEQKRHWRDQALEWVKADLSLGAQAPPPGLPTLPVDARRRLRSYQEDDALHIFRVGSLSPDPLPPEERSVWQKVWQDIESLQATKDAPILAVKRRLESEVSK